MSESPVLSAAASDWEPTADELLKDVTGAEIEMSAVGDRVRERLS